MAPLAQSLVSRLSERWPPGGRQYTMVVEALVSLDAARVATRIATRVATVYTNAQNGSEGAVFANLCTLLRPPPTAARTTGWGHGSHDIDGPMAPVMPGRSNLRLAHRGGVATTHSHELTKPLFSHLIFSSHGMRK